MPEVKTVQWQLSLCDRVLPATSTGREVGSGALQRLMEGGCGRKGRSCQSAHQSARNSCQLV